MKDFNLSDDQIKAWLRSYNGAHELDKQFELYGIDSMGYYKDLNQRGLSVCSFDNVQATCNALVKILPHYKATVKERKIIDCTRADKDCAIYIMLEKCGGYFVEVHQYQVTVKRLCFTSLIDALTYIRDLEGFGYVTLNQA